MSFVDINWKRIPAQLEIDAYGFPLGLSVETRRGIVWVDVSAEELDLIANENAGNIHVALLAEAENRKGWSRHMVRELRNDQP